jgi:putative flippase GtrA
LLWPYLAMVPGVLAGMMLNYIFSRFWIFSSINQSKEKPI